MLRIATVLALLCITWAGDTSADPPDPDEGFRAEVLYQIDDAYTKMIHLAEALPNEAYRWRPGEGVRSVSEAFMHVVESNYFLTGPLIGVSVPDRYGDTFTASGATGVLERQVTAKDEVIRELNASHEFLRTAIRNLEEDDLPRSVDWFDEGVENTVRGTLLHLVKHTFEHHGQLVAYARMNDVVPPWSR